MCLKNIEPSMGQDFLSTTLTTCYRKRKVEIFQLDRRVVITMK